MTNEQHAQTGKRRGSARFRAWAFIALTALVVAGGAGALLLSVGKGEATRADRDGEATGSSPRVPDFPPEAYRNARYNELLDNKDISEYSDAERARYMIDEEVWGNAEFVSASNTGELASRWRTSSLRDPGELLDARQREALLRTVAEHARVRSLPTPDAYLALLDGDPGSGLRPASELRTGGNIEACFMYFAETPIPEDADSETILRRAWEGLARHDHLFDEAGVGEDGAAFLIRRVQTTREARSLGLSGKYALDASRWQSMYFGGTMRFSERNPTLEATLDASQSALVAFGHVLVRYRDGRIANWMNTWFYDDASGRWRPSFMQTSIAKTALVVW